MKSEISAVSVNITVSADLTPWFGGQEPALAMKLLPSWWINTNILPQM
jgi:hypothetical protein